MIRHTFTLLSALTVLSTHAADRWPEFRGPTGQGYAHGPELPIHWSETNNITWKTPIPGEGWSSPVIEHGVIWMTTASHTEVDAAERERRVKGLSNPRSLNPVDDLRLRAICVDQQTGHIRHDITLLSPEDPPPIHQQNSYASPSPVIDNGRVYCHFGTHGTFCLDAGSGRILWKNTDLPIAHYVGPGSSIIQWKDTVIFHADGADTQHIVALKKRSGKIAWKTKRSGKMDSNPDFKKSFGTPLVTQVHGRDQLVSPASNWLYSYNPITGKERWKISYEKLGFSVVPRPVAGHGMLYLSTGFMSPEILAVRHRDTDGDSPPEIAWRYKKGVPSQSSPLLVDDALYIVSDRSGILTCLDARSGEERWKHRIAGNYSASPTYANGRLYFSNREGITTVLEPGPKPKTLARNRLKGRHMASFAVADNAFFVRTDKALYRIANHAKGNR